MTRNLMPTKSLIVSIVAMLAAGCSSGHSSSSDATASTVASTPTTAPHPVPRSEVVAVEALSLPQSTVLTYYDSAKLDGGHWATIVSKLPAELPVPGHDSCTKGPVLIAILADGSQIEYKCNLPSAIAAARAFVISSST